MICKIITYVTNKQTNKQTILTTLGSTDLGASKGGWCLPVTGPNPALVGGFSGKISEAGWCPTGPPSMIVEVDGNRTDALGWGTFCEPGSDARMMVVPGWVRTFLTCGTPMHAPEVFGRICKEE